MTDDIEDLDGVDADAIEITAETAEIIKKIDRLISTLPFGAEDIITAMVLTTHFAFEGLEIAIDEGGSVDLTAIVDATRIVGSTVLLGRKISKKHGN